MKELNGRELAGYVKERQSHQAKALKSRKMVPKLAIFYDNDSPVIAKYMQLKKTYGADIGVEVEITKITPDDAVKKMLDHNGPYLLEVKVEKEGNVFPMVPAGCSVSEIRLE